MIIDELYCLDITRSATQKNWVEKARVYKIRFLDTTKVLYIEETDFVGYALKGRVVYRLFFENHSIYITEESMSIIKKLYEKDLGEE